MNISKTGYPKTSKLVAAQAYTCEFMHFDSLAFVQRLVLPCLVLILGLRQHDLTLRGRLILVVEFACLAVLSSVEPALLWAPLVLIYSLLFALDFCFRARREVLQSEGQPRAESGLGYGWRPSENIA